MRSAARTRRGAAALAALFGLLGGLTGCADRTAPPGRFTTDADPSEVTGTLHFMTPGYPTSPEGKAALNKVIDTFHETYPKVKVETDLASWAHLNEKVATSIASGDMPDVMVTGVGWIPRSRTRVPSPTCRPSGSPLRRSPSRCVRASCGPPCTTARCTE